MGNEIHALFNLDYHSVISFILQCYFLVLRLSNYIMILNFSDGAFKRTKMMEILLSLQSKMEVMKKTTKWSEKHAIYVCRRRKLQKVLCNCIQGLSGCISCTKGKLLIEK